MKADDRQETARMEKKVMIISFWK